MTDPLLIARTVPTTSQVFHTGGYRHPSQRITQRRWLHQLLGHLPEIDRVAIFMELNGSSQSEIAQALQMSQPGVSWRLKAAKRRLKSLALLPSPPITLEECAQLGLSRRDSEIVVRLQSARASEVAASLGLTWHVMARARDIRAQLPNPSRVKALLDLVCTRNASPFGTRHDQRKAYRSSKIDAFPLSSHDPSDH